MAKFWRWCAEWCLRGSGDGIWSADLSVRVEQARALLADSEYVVTTSQAIDDIAQVAASCARAQEADRFDREWLRLIEELGEKIEPALKMRNERRH